MNALGNRYAISSPDKLGTEPVAVDGIDGHRRGNGEEGEEPASKHKIDDLAWM